MHDFDSYLLYEIKKCDYFPVRIKVVLTEPVREEVLRPAAEKAFRRFPYYSRRVTVDDEGAYVFEPCPKPITVSADDHTTMLGTAKTNDLLFAITYEGNNLYFNFAHSFCGADGAMRWLKATLWQYLTDLGYSIDSTGILTEDVPITQEESAEPDVDSLPTDRPLGNFDFPRDAFVPVTDFIEYAKDPEPMAGYYPIVIPKTEFIQYARANDGSPSSIVSVLLFKMFARVYPDQTKFVSSIACNYRADVGCPETHRDMVRQLYIPYDAKIKDWPVKKLSTITRGRMYVQMQPEASWEHCRKMDAFRKEIDAQPDLDSKVDYAVDHSPPAHSTPATYVVSYVGRIEWGGLAPFIQGVFTMCFGLATFEINATDEAFCLTFQTLRKDGKYGAALGMRGCKDLKRMP